MPQASIDPVVMAAATVLRLQTIVSREVAAAEAAVVTVGVLQVIHPTLRTGVVETLVVATQAWLAAA